MVVVAAFIAIAEQKLSSKKELRRIILLALGMCLFSAIMMVLSFRLFQPMSFRAPTGNTSLLTWHINRDWWDSMQVAAAESSGIGGGPPSEQWAHRIPVLFPLINMIFTAWASHWELPSGRRTIRTSAHYPFNKQRMESPADSGRLVLLLFMGTRFVMYPLHAAGHPMFVCWQPGADSTEASKWLEKHSSRSNLFRPFRRYYLGSGIRKYHLWAGTLPCRAVRWIYENIPAVFNLPVRMKAERTSSVSSVNATVSCRFIQTTFEQTFIPARDIRLPTEHAACPLHFSIRRNTNAGSSDHRSLSASDIDDCALPKNWGRSVDIPLNSTYFKKGSVIHSVNLRSGSELMLRRNVIANELGWRFAVSDGYDPLANCITE